jgi:hypothetical protein
MTEADFQIALNTEAPIVVAWNIDLVSGQRSVMVFETSSGGVDGLQSWAYAEAQVAGVRAALSARGFRQGHFDSFGPCVWVCEAGEVVVWDQERVLLEAKADSLRTRTGPALSFSEVSAVIAYVDERDCVERGLNLRLRDGRVVNAFFHLSEMAALGQRYGLDEVVADTAWLVHLGRGLARLMRADFLEELPHPAVAIGRPA